MLKALWTYFIRLLIATPFLFLIWFAGYNTGSNKGYAIATKLERESCEHQMKVQQEGQSCRLPERKAQ